MIRHYHLRANKAGSAGMLIEDDGEKLTWANWSEVGYLQVQIGRARIIGDVLVLYANKPYMESAYKNWSEVLSYLNTLPRWERTRYFMHIAGGWRRLYSVETCSLLPGDIGEKILADYGICFTK